MKNKLHFDLTPRVIHIVFILLILGFFACDAVQVPIQEKKNKPVIDRKSPGMTTMKALSIPNISAEMKPHMLQNAKRPNLVLRSESVPVDFEKLASVHAVKSVQLNDTTIHLLIHDELEMDETPKQTRWMLRLNIDNDIFNNTDYYYTHGSNIELITPFASKSPLNKILAATKKRDLDFSGFSLTQNIYTPVDPDAADIQTGDRPFAAYLTVGQFREVHDFQKHIYLKSSIEFGIMGPSSLGGKFQSSIHEIPPLGWQNQINDDFIINYTIYVQKGILNKKFFEFDITGSASLGTLTTHAGGGFNMRIGTFADDYWGPVSMFGKRPSTGKYQFWFFVKSSANLVAYDATLEGGLFNTQNPYVISEYDMNPLVLKASAGFALYHENVGVEVENNYITPEFKAAKQFLWGRIKLVLAF